MSRAPVLACLLLVATAGCLSGAPETTTHHVEVVNADDEAHNVTVRLTSDGETVAEETHRIAPGANWTVEPSTNLGEFTLLVETATGNESSESYSLQDGPETQTATVDVLVAANGSVSMDVGVLV